MEATSEGAGSPVATYQVAAYQPEGGFDSSGMGLLTGGLMVTAGVLGAISHFIGMLFWLVIIFPTFIGLGLGLVGTRLARYAHVRNPVMGGVAGLIAGIVAMTTMHYGDYWQFRNRLENEMASSPALKRLYETPEDKVRELISDKPQDDQKKVMEAWRLVHTDTFARFMEFSAEEGVSIRHHGSQGMNLGYVGTWIYWVVEVAIVAGLTFVVVREATSQPYCTACGQWKNLTKVGSLGATPAAVRQALERGAIGEWRRQNPTPQAGRAGGVDVTVAECPECAGTGAMEIRLESVDRDKKGNLKRDRLAQVRYPAAARTELAAIFAPAPAAPPTPAPTATSNSAPAGPAKGLARMAEVCKDVDEKQSQA